MVPVILSTVLSEVWRTGFVMANPIYTALPRTVRRNICCICTKTAQTDGGNDQQDRVNKKLVNLWSIYGVHKIAKIFTY